MEYLVNGQQMVNTFTIFGDEAIFDWTPTTAQGLADHIAGSVLPSKFAALLQSDSSLQQVIVRELLAPSDTSVPDQGVAAPALTGTMGATGLDVPTPCCAVLTIGTNAAIRSGHGRMFLPPLRRSGNVSGDDVSATYVAAVAPLITELGHWNTGGSHWANGNWGIGVYSRTRRARAIATFAFHANAYTLRAPITWLESRRVHFA